MSWQPAAQPRAWKYVVFHHTATVAADVATIDEAHRQRVDSAGKPWLGIGYHFVIGNGQGMPDGLVEPTFRWTEQLHGAHAANREYNEHGIGICLVGDFTAEQPTERQVAAAAELVRQLREQYGITATNVIRHSDLVATECPGELFPLDRILSCGDDRTTSESDLQTATISSRSL
ncbi:MAG TPA: peptidoglycan recognition family protein [Pirellulales bacterium]|nr:peptidoglycan recognition family protein [Pirellulales bacterium]